MPISPIPPDAAAWLTAHFDWSFGAVWVACERWRVDAATVVAWAERLRCGGARAGLGGKERTWILAQLSDPEQRPSAVEMAMARTYFRGQETTPPLTVASIDDAIALLTARLDEDADDRTTRAERDLRALLCDDLRVLRSEQQREEERQPTMASPSTTTTTPTYETREALCAYCGKPFTAKRYSSGWTTYCSPSCGGKARFHNLPKCTEPVVAPESTAEALDAYVAAEVAAMPTVKELYHEALDAYNAAQGEVSAQAQGAYRAESNTALYSMQQSISAIDRLRALDGAQADSADQSGGDNGDNGDNSDSDDNTESTYPLLRALIDRLPTGGMWSGQARARWLRAFEATLDLDVWTEGE